MFIVIAMALSITLSSMNEEPEGENITLIIVNTACASVALLSIVSVFRRKGFPVMKKDISNNINYARDELYKWTEKEEADEAWATIKAKSERSSKRASIVMIIYIVAMAAFTFYSLAKGIIDATAGKFSTASITLLICYAITIIPLVLLLATIEKFVSLAFAVGISESIVKNARKASRRDNWPPH